MCRYTRFISNLTALAIAIAVSGCSSVPNPSGPPAAHQSRDVFSFISAEQASDVSIYAVGLVGTPYRYGGNTPAAGFDCSGLIGYVYQTQAGVKTPRTVNRLQAWGQVVSRDHARAGDLVIFAPDKTATHAGIYVGKGRFVHAPSTGGEVRLDHLNSKYWSSQQVSFRRP